MTQTRWTPSLVEERLADAALVLRRLPAEKTMGYFSTWPVYFHEFGDLVGQEPRMSAPCPSPAAISRMEEALNWTVGLKPVDGRILWMRAHGERWKQVCCTVSLSRSAAHEHWLFGLCVIAFRLNGQRLNPKLGRRSVITLARVRLPEAA